MGRDFDREWSTGYWDYMRGLSHVSRYGMLASLILHEREMPKVLDVGCGEGTLFEHLAGKAGYVGFDISAEAVALGAKKHGAGGARFSAASVTEFKSEEKFDVIVFNAILYLFSDKRSIVARYARMLNKGGLLIIENHTTFRDANEYFQRVAAVQKSRGWERNHEALPFDWMGPLFEDYRHEAHYTLINWSVANDKFPCRHVHLFRLREEVPTAKPAASPAANPAPALKPVARGGFSTESAPYIFGTETMGGVLEGLDVAGKSVLTVLGGADQLLNFVWAGAREVVGFDISRAASYVAELKFAALRELERTRYFALMLSLQSGATGDAKSTVAKLLPRLSAEAAGYFREALETKFNVKVRSRNPITLTKINPYLQSDQAYLRTRKNLGEGKFLTADLFAIPEQLERKFDVVYAANVLDFNRAGSAEAVRRLWHLVNPGGCVASYEFASHKRWDGEYGPGTLKRNEFEGCVYGGRDFLALVRRETGNPSGSNSNQNELNSADSNEADSANSNGVNPPNSNGANSSDLQSGDAELEALRAALGAGTLSDFGPIGSGAQSSHLQRASLGDRTVVLRAPRKGTGADSPASYRSHRLMRELAVRIGAPHLALPAALIETPAALREKMIAEQLVATPLMSESSRPADRVSSQLLAQVSEEDRLAAALLCVLTAQCDAVPKNVFITSEARPILVDLDTCLGRFVWWGKASTTCFAPGGKLGYASAQETFEALPNSLAALVREVLAGNDFQLEPNEARAMRSCARAIQEKGLTAAAKRPLPERA